VVVVLLSILLLVIAPSILAVVFALSVLVIVMALGIFLVDVVGKGFVVLLPVMGTSLSPPQPGVLSTITSITTSNDQYIVVSAPPT
jgi:hypothetical protein